MCVGILVLGAHRDPRSHSDSVFQTIQILGGRVAPLEGRGFSPAGIRAILELIFVDKGDRERYSVKVFGRFPTNDKQSSWL
jgi:hypothetical protein